MDDVYAGLTELLRPAERGQAAGGWLFGQVQQAGHGVLRVVCNGLTLDQTELHRAARAGLRLGGGTTAAGGSCGRATGCWCW